MKKTVFCCAAYLVMLAVIAAAFVVSGRTGEKEIFLSGDAANFSDFWVDGDKAYIKCCLSIENTTGSDKLVNITATSAEDVRTGLLRDENIAAEGITVAPGVDTYTVIFVGDYGGTAIKHDRLGPDEIRITVID